MPTKYKVRPCGKWSEVEVHGDEKDVEYVRNILLGAGYQTSDATQVPDGPIWRFHVAATPQSVGERLAPDVYLKALD